MNAPAETPPLLTGAVPPAPAWFVKAVAEEPERSMIAVRGAEVEMLTWGEVGAPGLLFLHGKGAHADWWSFLAPFFSSRYRVVAISWSGMGRSGWRQAYSEDLLAEEAMAALEAGGALAAKAKPVVVAHSFGSLMAALMCERMGGRLGAAVFVDPPFFSRETIARRRERWAGASAKAHRVYGSVEEAVRRFRFSPWQPCENLFIADFIARRSLVRVEEGERAGWRWCLDPRHWTPDRQNAIERLPVEAGVPMTVILGSRSALYTPDDVRYIEATCRGAARLLTIPEAAHHVMVDQPLALVSVLRAVLADADASS